MNNCRREKTGAFRRFAEFASRGIVLRRRLPAAFGGKALYVSPECGLRYWRFDLQKVDPVLLQIIGRYVKDGDVVWDIGASVGLFTFAAAHRASTVVAIEPDPWVASLLERTAQAYNNVSIIRSAVADYCGTGELHIAVRGRAANFLSGEGSTQSGGTRRREQVRVVTLDSLQQPPPSVLKIDVEGLEDAVLRGASRILSECRPIVICEVCDERGTAVTRLLKDYVLLDAERGERVMTAVWTTVAIPSRRRQSVSVKSSWLGAEVEKDISG